MNRKALSLLIVVVMLLAVVPGAYSGVAATNNSNQEIVASLQKVPVSSGKNSEHQLSPLEKIEPKLLDILKGVDSQGVVEIDGKRWVMIHISSAKDISTSLRGIKILGKTRIMGDTIYLALIPAQKDSINTLIKIASIPEVKDITRSSPFEPIEVKKDPEEKIQSMPLPHSKFAERVKNWKPKVESLDGKKIVSVHELVSGELKELQKNSPAVNGMATIATPRRSLAVEPGPDDIFAVYHHGSYMTWLDLNVTGEGVNVAIIDSGVDFGNPDLQDAYAVDNNQNSPYYGWPIAFDGNSMIYYLVLGATFADAYSYRGYLYSWYTPTIVNVTPYIVPGYFSIGYKGNFTTVFTSMSLANIPSDSERAQLIYNTLQWVGNVSNVLLVDDDGGDVLETFYETALDALGVNYTYYEVPSETANGPNSTVLSAYDMVIWFTGGAWEYVLTDSDVGNLTSYLDAGGKLWLISDDYLYDGGLDNTTVQYEFTTNYLHVNVSRVMEDFPVPTVLYDYANGLYHGGEVYWGLYESPTDMYADYIYPDEEAVPLLVGYTAYAYDTFLGGIYIDIKLPLNDDLSVPTTSGIMKLGLHPDLALWGGWYGGFVLVTDPNDNAKYDTVYADIAPATVVDFNKDSGHTKDNPVIQLDFWNTFNGWFGQDGYADLSGGMIYYIADGKTPIPYSDKVAKRWGLPLRIPANGELVAFMIGNTYTAGGDHGTLCAAAVGARGRTFFGLTFGNAIDAKIIAEGSLYQGGSWIDYVYFAVEGYDGKPGTGDEAQIVSNSYGASSIINKGYTWADRFLYYITSIYSPTTTFFFAAGNGGPGYGTVTSEGSSPFVVTVGAAIEWGYRGLFGYDDGPWQQFDANYGDAADFSNKGPNALGQPDPDVLAVGEFALGSVALNSVGDGFWASDLWSGTSLATPMASGIAALVYQAYYEKHGRWPTSQEVKEILMSTAKNVNHDVFTQGAGFLDAYSAVEAAKNIDGIVVSPSEWAAGKTDYKGFANVLYPGESDSQTFIVRNMNPESAKEVNVSAEVFQKIDEVELDVVGNSWAYYRIDQFIPEDADLMKVTLYTSYDNFDNNSDYSPDAYPWFRIWDVTFVNGNATTNLLQQASKEGDVVSVMLGNPNEKYHDMMLIQIRDIWRFYGKTSTYPAKVKLEFYKRVPWEWVTLDKDTLTVGANGKAQFTAKISVPSNATYGVYEGAIYLKYDGKETTIPVSVVVASPTPEFEFGGNNVSSGLYDNGNVYGYFDWGWRYESGDWRLFYFNVPKAKEGSYVLADVSWDGTITDINLHLLGPSVDEWSMKYPDVMGQYSLKEIGRSDDGYVGGGLFVYQTSSGANEELIAGKASAGMHALWLHNVLFDGNASYRTFYGHVGMARIYPEKWLEVLGPKTGEKTFTVELPEWAGDLSVIATGFSTPIMYEDVIAPPTGDSDYYTVNVTTSPFLDVQLTSIWDDLAGVDLDLYVYYNASGTLVEVGSSLTSSSDEHVSINFPYPGQYIIEVYSYNNPAPGDATYDLTITTVEGNELQVSDIRETSTGYLIDMAYNLSDEHLNATTPLNGLILIGTNKNPVLFRIPVTITPAPYDVKISSVTTTGVPDKGGEYNITAYITNIGEYNATNVQVKLFRDGLPTDVQLTIPLLQPNEVYKATFSIPVGDAVGHSYKVVVSAPNDLNPDNNEKMVYAMAVDENNVPWTYAIGESIGRAKITKATAAGRRIYYLTIDGDHGTKTTVLLKLPQDTTYYNVRIQGATLLDVTSRKVADGMLLYITLRLNSPGTVRVEFRTQSDYTRISTMNYVWYMLYWRYDQKFDPLYQKAVELGVDNETLSLAMEHKKLADQYYEEAEKYLTPGREVLAIAGLPYIRKAYVHIREAYNILEEAIRELEGTEG
ncbi:S8 family serine peptidase [Thermococcus barossii]|uniref:Peptidase n=1 Tax=Thermococcus barossii TaxID=54077 RepID=A0A2Z2ME52_9EURY|nr:S8 family serine peptidase [Thermococcus barossii]ASJ04126.1 peptidase [Thermococcus barossii]